MIDLKSDHCSRLLGILSDPLRLKIIECLGNGARSVGELAKCLDKHIVKVSHHLAVLRKAGFVKFNRRGKFIYYELQSGLISSTNIVERPTHLDLGCCRLEILKVSKNFANKV